MIKLNGNVYLKTNEVEIQIEKVSKRFRTSSPCHFTSTNYIS